MTLNADKKRRVFYPDSDGKPFAEGDRHFRVMAYLIDGLQAHFNDRQDVYVSGNNFLYYEEGNPKSRVSPDAYIVFGVGMHLRDKYLAWLEGWLLPDVVFEVTSKKTRREDTNAKFPLYEQVLKTPEYFLFDPTGDYLRPRLQGYRLQDGRYVRLELVNNRLHSERLGLDLVQDSERLRLYDPAKGEFLPTAQEQAERIEAEACRAEDAEAELARLRAEITALKADLGN